MNYNYSPPPPPPPPPPPTNSSSSSHESAKRISCKCFMVVLFYSVQFCSVLLSLSYTFCCVCTAVFTHTPTNHPPVILSLCAARAVYGMIGYTNMHSQAYSVTKSIHLAIPFHCIPYHHSAYIT